MALTDHYSCRTQSQINVWDISTDRSTRFQLFFWQITGLISKDFSYYLKSKDENIDVYFKQPTQIRSYTK